MIVFKCPICDVTLQVDAALAHRRVRCPKCRQVAVVPATTPVAVGLPPPLPAPLTATEDVKTVLQPVERDFHLDADEEPALPADPAKGHAQDFHLESDQEDVPYLDPVDEDVPIEEPGDGDDEILDVLPADDGGPAAPDNLGQTQPERPSP